MAIPLESVYQDALQAWNAYQATGHHVLQDEEAWLTQLESGHDIDPPPCHR